jgi:hypothetical protein
LWFFNDQLCCALPLELIVAHYFQHDTLWFFNDQLCRALPLVFHQTVLHKGLPSYRYSIFKHLFALIKSQDMVVFSKPGSGSDKKGPDKLSAFS